jgi:hypothetical protein
MLSENSDGVAYIYLNGISLKREVDLGDNVRLLPAHCDIPYSKIGKWLHNEYEAGIAIAFLNRVSSCLCIQEKDSKQLAIKTWNSMWRAITIGALLNVEIGFNFQSDKPPQEIHKARHFGILNYQFGGLNTFLIQALKEKDLKFLENYYSKAYSLLDNDRYQLAIHSLWSYRWHSMPRAQLAILWGGIEGLFNIDYELRFRLSQYISRYLYKTRCEGQIELYESVKKLYDIRSRAVHGGKLKNEGQALRDTVKLLNLLVLKIAEEGSLPDISKLAP